MLFCKAKWKKVVKTKYKIKQKQSLSLTHKQQ